MIFFAILVGVPITLWAAIVLSGGSVRWNHEADTYVPFRERD